MRKGMKETGETDAHEVFETVGLRQHPDMFSESPIGHYTGEIVVSQSVLSFLFYPSLPGRRRRNGNVLAKEPAPKAKRKMRATRAIQSSGPRLLMTMARA